MLSYETMGLLALGILWVNTLLIAAAAAKDLLALAALKRPMGELAEDGVALARARVTRGGGEGNLLAAYRVEQVGRAVDRDSPSILFADRAAEGEVWSGLVTLEPSGREVEIKPPRGAAVWVRREELSRASECPSGEAFDLAYASARKARGFSRTVSTGIRAGEEVFVFGHFRQKGVILSLDPPRGGELIVASFDPRRWISGKILLIAGFIAATLAAAAACTFVALLPPLFGITSKLGGALCLAFFLLIQPAGTMVRAAVQTPNRSLLGGRWQRRGAPAPSGDPANEGAAFERS